MKAEGMEDERDGNWTGSTNQMVSTERREWRKRKCEKEQTHSSAPLGMQQKEVDMKDTLCWTAELTRNSWS
jgi:hypothetical protein